MYNILEYKIYIQVNNIVMIYYIYVYTLYTHIYVYLKKLNNIIKKNRPKSQYTTDYNMKIWMYFQLNCFFIKVELVISYKVI